MSYLTAAFLVLAGAAIGGALAYRETRRWLRPLLAQDQQGSNRMSMIRVLEIAPPTGNFHFGGGEVMPFVEVDWFRDDDRPNAFATAEGRREVEEFIRKKSYFSEAKAYLVLHHLHPFTIGYDPDAMVRRRTDGEVVDRLERKAALDVALGRLERQAADRAAAGLATLVARLHRIPGELDLAHQQLHRSHRASDQAAVDRLVAERERILGELETSGGEV